MSIALGAVRGLYKKRPNFEKCFFLRNDISQVLGWIFTKIISHLENGSKSGQKKFFLKICIFRKVTGPKKKILPKNLSNPYFAPPLSIWAHFFQFFHNSSKSPKKCLWGFLKPKFSILSTKKSKIDILLPEITQISHSAIFRKNRFFHVFNPVSAPWGQKNRFSQNFSIGPKNCL